MPPKSDHGKAGGNDPNQHVTSDEPSFPIGYARVSTRDQNLDLQIAALEKYGCLKHHIHVEKVSGVSSRRPEWSNCKRDMRRGDTLVVWRLDRIGRDVRSLLNEIHDLALRGIRFVSITENIDTATASGKLMLNIHASMAQFERDLTIERTKAGIAARKARGEQHGAPKRFDREKARAMLADGKSAKEVAKRMNVTRAAIYQAFPPEERAALFRKWQRRKPK